MLFIERIIESTPYGKSAPIKVVADDGKTYILKFRKDYLSGMDRSITSELIAYRLIQYFEQKQSDRNHYDFLDISKNTPANKHYFYNKLEMNNIKPFSFRNEEDIVEYFELIS